MGTNTAHAVKLLAAVAVFSAAAGVMAGCGNATAGGQGGESDADQVRKAGIRARQVADAWDGSRAAEVWRKGYDPLGPTVQLPRNAFRSEADKNAYLTRNFVLRGELPATGHEDGQVRWDNGDSLTLPLTGAEKAYATLDHTIGDGPHLTVTRVRLGEMDVDTSRGPATVPAWLFTLDGYDTPLRQAALSPSDLPEPPIGPDARVRGLGPMGRLVAVGAGGRSISVVVTSGGCDPHPEVHVLETDGSVVLSASSTATAKKVRACAADLRGEEVTVRLRRPLGERIILDAATGRPVSGKEETVIEFS